MLSTTKKRISHKTSFKDRFKILKKLLEDVKKIVNALTEWMVRVLLRHGVNSFHLIDVFHCLVKRRSLNEKNTPFSGKITAWLFFIILNFSVILGCNFLNLAQRNKYSIEILLP